MTSDFNQGSGTVPTGSYRLDETGLRRETSGSVASEPGRYGSDASLGQAASREASSLRAEAGAASEAIKEGAADIASAAKERAFQEAERGKETVSSGLDDFAAAIRRASEELGSRDQSMASNLVREVASGLEQATGSIKGKSIQELTQSVAGFARRQPTAFLIGAALAGVALGRFARASGSGPHEDARHDGVADQGTAWDRPPVRSRSSWEEEGSAPFPSTSVRQPDPVTGASAAVRRPGPDDALLGRGSGSFNPGGADNVR